MQLIFTHILWIWILLSVHHNFWGSEAIQGTHIDALNPFSSKLMALTLRGGLWTFLANLALCATQLTAPSKTDANSCLKSNKCRELAKKILIAGRMAERKKISYLCLHNWICQLKTQCCVRYLLRKNIVRVTRKPIFWDVYFLRRDQMTQFTYSELDSLLMIVVEFWKITNHTMSSTVCSRYISSSKVQRADLMCDVSSIRLQCSLRWSRDMFFIRLQLYTTTSLELMRENESRKIE